MVERSTSAMVEGALLAGLTALLVLIGIYIPPLALLINLIWTIPLAVIIVRHELRTGVMATIVAGLLVMMFSEPVTAFFIFLQFGALGLVYGVFFKRKISAGRAILWGSTVAAIFMMLSLAFSVVIMGAPVKEIPRQMEQMADESMDIYKQTGLMESFEKQGMTEEDVRRRLEQMVRLVVALIPGIMVISAMVSAFLNYILARLVLIRLGYQVPGLPPFKEWYLPAQSVWGVIGALAAVLLGDYLGVPALKTVGQNVLYVYLPLLLVTGLSVTIYYYHKFKIPPLFKGLIVFIAIINLPIAMGVVVLLGTFDTVVDYRGLKTKARGG